MKHATDDLFQLILSMTPKEKGHFGRYAKKHKTGSANISLFDAVNKLAIKQDSYDEKELVRIIGNENFLNYLPAAKSKLYDLIIESLRVYRRSANKSVEINELLEDATILIEKGLYRQSEKILNKTRKLIQKHDIHWALIPLINLQRKLIHNSRRKNYITKLNELDVEAKRTVSIIEANYKLQSFYEKIFRLVRAGSNSVDPQTLKKLEAEMKLPYLNDVSNVSTLSAKQRYYQIHALYHHLRHNYPKEAEFRRLSIELIEKHSDHKGKYSHEYVIALAELAKLLLRRETLNLEEFRSILITLKTIKGNNFDECGELFQNTCFLELQYVLSFDNPLDHEELLYSIVEGMNKYDARISPSRFLVFKFNLAIALLLCGAYRPTAELLREITENVDIKVRNDIKSTAKLILPFVYFEMQECALAEQAYRSAYRNIVKSQSHKTFEQSLKEHLLKQKKTCPEVLDSTAFFTLRNALRELDGVAEESRKLGREAIIKWITMQK